MRTKVSPPGFQPHQTLSRLDGWIGSADRMPDGVAKEIFAAMPPLRDRDVVEIIRARMIARQHAYDRRAALERSFGARDDE